MKNERTKWWAKKKTVFSCKIWTLCWISNKIYYKHVYKVFAENIVQMFFPFVSLSYAYISFIIKNTNTRYLKIISFFFLYKFKCSPRFYRNHDIYATLNINSPIVILNSSYCNVFIMQICEHFKCRLIGNLPFFA